MALRWMLAALFLAVCVGVGWGESCYEGGCREGFANSTAGFCVNETRCDCTRNIYNETITCFNFTGNATDSCKLLKCYRYDEGINGTCMEGRRSRTTALLLSIFLINFGAANFYIERYELAVPQIVLGLLLCIFQVGACAAAGLRDDETSKSCVVCCGVNSVFSLLFLAWWIADLVIFATNSRTDGMGCVLFT